jgi:hypothetical protein
LLLLSACAALAACNMAISDHPMFSAQDRLTTPLKDGLWVADDPDCPLDVKLPRGQWPNCAFWTVVSGNQFVDFSGDKDEERPTGSLIVQGRPPIIQVEMVEKGDRMFVFFAIEPTGSDAAGAVTAMNLRAVACGAEKTPGSSQVEPYPGFDKDCRPSTTKALRAAAVASRSKPDKIGRIYWVRAETP